MMGRAALARLLRPITRKIRSLVARAVVTAIDDSGGRLVVQLQAGKNDTLDGVEAFQPYGFFGIPLPPDAAGAAEAIALFAGGVRAHGLAAVIADRRYWPTGQGQGSAGI